jgi:Holliday junction resolvasome RuvABC endonuclease subunit
MRDDGIALAGSISTSPKIGTLEGRLALIRSSLAELFREFDPGHLAVEGYAYQGERSHGPNGFVISRIVGMCEGIAESNKVESLTVLDKNTVNRSLGLTGEVPKARVRLMVESALKIKAGLLRNEHEVDAAALGFVAYLRLRRWQ